MHFPKSKLVATVAIAVCTMIGAITLSGCASTPRQESTGQYIDSSAVTAKIKSKLLADDVVKALPISVKTYKGHVELSGFVDTQTQKARAVHLARTVEGVKSVTDALVIKPLKQ